MFNDTAPLLLLPPPAPVKRSRWYRLLHWEYFWLVVILAVTLIFHFVAIDNPPSIVWDEVWYVGDARSIISGAGELRPEHPPLAKLYIVVGDYVFNGFKKPENNTGVVINSYISSTNDKTVISVDNAAKLVVGSTIRIDSEQMTIDSVDAGQNLITVDRGAGGSTVTGHPEQSQIFVYTDNAVGWRFFSIIFGTLGIVLVYFICRKLKFSWKGAMIATFLFALDDMTFLHSGLALLDVYMVTFMLAAILLYLDNRYILSGVFVALSAECKLLGVLIIIAIFLHWLIYRRDKAKTFLASLIIAAVAFVFFLVFFDIFIKGGIENPITRIRDLLSSTAANQFTVPKLSISSRPWTWLYPQWLMPYYNSPNVPFIAYGYDPQYISFISSTIQILIVPAIGYLVYKAIKKSEAAGFLLLWFLATYLVWIPLDIVTNRVTFVFYFLPTIPMICMGLGMALSDALEFLKARREKIGRLSNGVKISYGVIVFYLFLHLAIFVFFNPAIPSLIQHWLNTLA
ncbi:MAG TPA: phospholipid carrier-dependent glycosyltransferase [Dehalococcoidales bacterium]|nr:phospholipid carrier-dependent glycosyltransferase [Dehalococcoidales bacterium]